MMPPAITATITAIIVSRGAAAWLIVTPSSR